MKPARRTLVGMFQESVDSFPEVPALMGKTGGSYIPLTYRQMALKVRNFGRGLMALGIQRKDRIALLSVNRPEWAIADISFAHIGAINVATFPNSPKNLVEYIISDSGSKAIVISDLNHLKIAMEIRNRNKNLRIIAMEPLPHDASDILTFDEVIRLGEESPKTVAEFEERLKNIRPEDWASIIYTSGTMGDPKGVILSHYNFVSNVEAAREVLRFAPGEVILSFIPLNHAMGRLADHYLPLSTGSTVAYIESLLRLRQNLQEVKPHYMLLVPRVLEMFHEGLLTGVAKEPGSKQKIFNWALSVGKEYCRQIETRQTSPLFQTFLRKIADKLVYQKIRSRLGLERLRFFFSGGAPLPRSTAEFFCALNISIMEGYGLTETSPLVAVNPANRLKFGTVGLPIRGVEVKIDTDGEILVHGPNVMQGYYNRLQETSEIIDSEGWLHTGDIGEFDEEGYLKITDRKKNLIVLSNGKKVAPQPFENRLAESPFIAHAIIIGDKRSTITALLSPHFKNIRDWAEKSSLDVDLRDNGALAKHREVERLIKGEIDRLLPELADYEKVRKFTIIGEEFTVDNGVLTPTLKVKKRVLLERYKDVIGEMYR